MDKIDKFIIVWRMQKRGKRLVWVEYSYEGHNIERNLVQSSTYDVREFPPLQLHKIPKNFQLWLFDNKFQIKIKLLFYFIKPKDALLRETFLFKNRTGVLKPQDSRSNQVLREDS